MKTKNNKNKTGFTLFELLVSISIIAVLTGVAMVSYSGLNKKTRDSRRTADLEKIRISLEAARQIGSTYPTRIIDLAPTYLDKEPLDPKTKATYGFRRITTTTYEIGASMEDLGSTNSSTITINTSGVNKVCNYRLTNP